MTAIAPKALLAIAPLIAWAGVPLAHGARAADKPVKRPPQVSKEDSGQWMLAGREGECAPISILARKGPEYADIQSPYQLAKKLQAAGHKAEIKEFSAGTRPAVEVRSPSAGLAIMFVKKELCDQALPPAEKSK
jgi:hypothetical protein